MSTKEVVLTGGSPWGFRMHGGSDTGQPLRISRVNPGSKAAQKGVREGDVISSINGQPTRTLTNSESHALLRNAGQSLRLGLNEDCGGSPKRRNYKMASSLSATPIQNESSKTETTTKSGETNNANDVSASKPEAQQTQKERPSGRRSGRGRKNGTAPQPPSPPPPPSDAPREAERGEEAEDGAPDGDAFAGQRSRRAKRGARARRRARARAEGSGKESEASAGCVTSGCETEGKNGSGGERGKSPRSPAGGAEIEKAPASGSGCDGVILHAKVCGDGIDERSKELGRKGGGEEGAMGERVIEEKSAISEGGKKTVEVDVRCEEVRNEVTITEDSPEGRSGKIFDAPASGAKLEEVAGGKRKQREARNCGGELKESGGKTEGNRKNGVEGEASAVTAVGKGGRHAGQTKETKGEEGGELRAGTQRCNISGKEQGETEEKIKQKQGSENETESPSEVSGFGERTYAGAEDARRRNEDNIYVESERTNAKEEEKDCELYANESVGSRAVVEVTDMFSGEEDTGANAMEVAEDVEKESEGMTQGHSECHEMVWETVVADRSDDETSGVDKRVIDVTRIEKWEENSFLGKERNLTETTPEISSHEEVEPNRNEADEKLRDAQSEMQYSLVQEPLEAKEETTEILHTGNFAEKETNNPPSGISFGELKESVATYTFECIEWKIAEEFSPVDYERSTEFEIVIPGKKSESHLTSVAVPLLPPAKSTPGCEEAPCGQSGDESQTPDLAHATCGEPRDIEPLTSPSDFTDVGESDFPSINLPPLPPPPFTPPGLGPQHDVFSFSTSSDQSDIHPVSDLPHLSSLSSSPTPPSSPPPAAFSSEEPNPPQPLSPLPLPPEAVPNLEGSLEGLLPFGDCSTTPSLSPSGGSSMSYDVSTTPPLPLHHFGALPFSSPPPSPPTILITQEASGSFKPSTLNEGSLSLEEERSPLPGLPEEADIRRILQSMHLEDNVQVRSHISYSRSGGPSPRRRRRGRADTFPPAARGSLEVIEEERNSGNSDDGGKWDEKKEDIGRSRKEIKTPEESSADEEEKRKEGAEEKEASGACVGGCGEDSESESEGSYTLTRIYEAEGEDGEKDEEWAEGWREEEFVEEKEGEEEVTVTMLEEDSATREEESGKSDEEGIVVIELREEESERGENIERRLSRELFIIPESDEEREEREERMEREKRERMEEIVEEKTNGISVEIVEENNACCRSENFLSEGLEGIVLEGVDEGIEESIEEVTKVEAQERMGEIKEGNKGEEKEERGMKEGATECEEIGEVGEENVSRNVEKTFRLREGETGDEKAEDGGVGGLKDESTVLLREVGISEEGARISNEEVSGKGIVGGHEDCGGLEFQMGAIQERCSSLSESSEGVASVQEGIPTPLNLTSIQGMELGSIPEEDNSCDKGQGVEPSEPESREEEFESENGHILHDSEGKVTEAEEASSNTTPRPLSQASDSEEIMRAFDSNKPESLLTICLKRVAGLPYGLDILREIWTCTPPVLPEREWRRSPAPSPEGRPPATAQGVQESGVDGGGEGEGYCNTTVPKLDTSERERWHMHTAKERGARDRTLSSISDRAEVEKSANRTLWVPVPTHGSVNICLTPKQLEGFAPSPEQAARLLDMHVKFLERRGYHERKGEGAGDTSRAQIHAEGCGTEGCGTEGRVEEGGSRLLAILLGKGAAVEEEDFPPSVERSPPPIPTPPHIRPSSADSLSSSVGRAGVGMGTGHDEDGAPAASDHRRLKTRVLSEWLTLARSGDAGKEGEGLSPPSDSGAGSCSPRRSPPTPEEKVEELEIFVQPRKMPEARTTTTTTTMRHSSYFEKTESMVEDCEAEGVPPEGVVEVRRRQFDADKYRISKQGDIAIEIPTSSANGGASKGGGGGGSRRHGKRPVSMPPAITGGEIFRQQMYMEYMNKVAERAERKQQKVIKLTAWGGQDGGSSSGSHAEPCAATEERFVNEFMGRVKQRMDRMGMKEEDEEWGGEGEGEGDPKGDPKEERTLSFTIEGGLTELPKHLRDDTDLLLADDGSLVIAPTFKATANRPPGVWSPSKSVEDLRSQSSSDQTSHKDRKSEPPKETGGKEDVAPVWVPKSAGPSPTLERKEFRPVNFDVNSIKTKKSEESGSRNLASPKPEDSFAWSSKSTVESTTTTSSSTERRSFIQSPTSPSSGSSIPPFSSRLPRAQNPTITLLQKAREGQLPRGAHYLDEKEKMISKDNETDIMYVKKEFETEDEKRKRKIVELGPKKFEGIGPTTKEGIPIILRSGIKEENQGKWYRKMYDSLHRTGKDDEYVTVRYKARRGQYPYTSAEGYLSEPDPIGYDSDLGYSAKYATLDRRRLKNKDYNFSTCTMPRSKYVPPPNKFGTTDVYKNQPGRIEDYEPGHSSIAEKEAKLHANQTQQPVKPYMAHALKESGYESDSTLLFKRREENIQSLSPIEQKQAYKTIQMGGEVPLHGLRKPAPERPKESPHKYVESEVTIHYRSPIRAQAKEALPEEELARRQEEAMRRIYQEERRRKYLQELQDMESRRHTDNFTPSQKSPIPLNRYDNFLDEVPSKIKGRDHTPEPKVVARALYNFVGQTSRELSFRKGDIIFVRRQIDKNWYEGEHNAMIGLFPFNYVEIIPYDGIRTMPKRPTEGQARAKYNFVAQTHLELSLIKGELVVLTRRVDNNWFEGRIGNRKGIFPISYVEVLVEPGERPVTPSNKSVTSKLAASPVSSSLNLNGSNVLSTTTYSQPYSQQYLGKQQRQYQVPNSYTTQKTSYVSSLGRNPYSSKTRSTSAPKLQLPSVNQTLHIDTHSDPVPYRALYNYKPQNEDELELQEGDTVYVMEKCDDGWYVGSSHRTGYFGTFPGNYVERI